MKTQTSYDDGQSNNVNNTSGGAGGGNSSRSSNKSKKWSKLNLSGGNGGSFGGGSSTLMGNSINLLSSNNKRNSHHNNHYQAASHQKNLRRNRKYSYLIKFMEKWYEFMVKIINWFLLLLYDVIYLSCGIIWDRLKLFYVYVLNFLIMVKQEMKNNSDLPMNLIKKCGKKIDAKFKKDSKLAFWRKFERKKIIPEPISDYYKNGRLPQTGDEAMYSLLNCKGKDAYSILGVTIESSQEQIRKHYKKIAVLVHPDKNKQPGAEEAFKILQRAFELIGEPENRKAYDQSVAEVLNVEKAWSELNDLLAQLHTKIAEAANTIR